jgi:hypothetical protein
MATQMVPQFTPAGRRFIDFLGTFNSGDPKAINEFIQKGYAPSALRNQSAAERLAQHVQWYKQIGRLIIRKFEQQSEFEINVSAESRENGAFYTIHMRVDMDAPYHILDFIIE